MKTLGLTDSDRASSPVAAGRDAIRPAAGYAGDVTPELAAQWVARGDAVLVDVRSDAEREWVGYVPGGVGLAWKQWPAMAPNPGFDETMMSPLSNSKGSAMISS